jgi:hypothetical protein
MTNTDPQTFMFIPMAISLAFGVLFATFITLFLVPSLYLMLDDWLVFIGKGEHSDDYEDSPVILIADLETKISSTEPAGS